MTVALITLNIVAGLFLVAVVLLQAGKGADMGAAFGGANPAAFGPAAQGNVLQRITALTAVVFMGSSLALAVVSARQESVFDGATEPAPLAAPVAIPGAAGADTATGGGQPATAEAQAGADIAPPASDSAAAAAVADHAPAGAPPSAEPAPVATPGAAAEPAPAAVPGAQ